MLRCKESPRRAVWPLQSGHYINICWLPEVCLPDSGSRCINVPMGGYNLQAVLQWPNGQMWTPECRNYIEEKAKSTLVPWEPISSRPAVARSEPTPTQELNGDNRLCNEQRDWQHNGGWTLWLIAKWSIVCCRRLECAHRSYGWIHASYSRIVWNRPALTKRVLTRKPFGLGKASCP